MYIFSRASPTHLLTQHTYAPPVFFFNYTHTPTHRDVKKGVFMQQAPIVTAWTLFGDVEWRSHPL